MEEGDDDEDDEDGDVRLFLKVGLALLHSATSNADVVNSSGWELADEFSKSEGAMCTQTFGVAYFPSKEKFEVRKASHEVPAIPLFLEVLLALFQPISCTGLDKEGLLKLRRCLLQRLGVEETFGGSRQGAQGNQTLHSVMEAVVALVQSLSRKSFDEEKLLKLWPRLFVRMETTSMDKKMQALWVKQRSHEGKGSLEEFSVSKSQDHLRERVDKEGEGILNVDFIFLLNKALCKGAFMLNNMDSDIQCFHVKVHVRIDVKNMMDGGVFSVHDDGYSGLQKDGGNVGLHQGRKRSKEDDYTNGPVDKNLPGFTRFTGSNVGQRPADTPLEKMDNARQSKELSMVSKDSHVLQKVETAVKLFKSLLEIIRNVLGGKGSFCSCADGKKKVETPMPHAMTRTYFLESQSTKETSSFLEITVKGMMREGSHVIDFQKEETCSSFSADHFNAMKHVPIKGDRFPQKVHEKETSIQRLSRSSRVTRDLLSLGSKRTDFQLHKMVDNAILKSGFPADFGYFSDMVQSTLPRVHRSLRQKAKFVNIVCLKCSNVILLFFVDKRGFRRSFGILGLLFWFDGPLGSC